MSQSLDTDHRGVSAHECRAMRALDRSGDYSRSEIAFMFEVQVQTVTRHVDRNCQHNDLEREGRGSTREHTPAQMLTAFRLVYDQQPFERLTSGGYESGRPDDWPAASTMIREFGSWDAVRAAAWGDDDE